MILSHHSRDYLLTPPPLGVALSHHADGSCTIKGAKPEGSLGTRCMEINTAQGYRVGTGTTDGEKTMMKYVYHVFEREGWLCLDRTDGPGENRCPSSRESLCSLLSLALQSLSGHRDSSSGNELHAGGR